MNQNFWKDMSEEGFMLVHAPKRKVAVFPNDSGMVALATEDYDGQCLIVLDVTEINDLISLLQAAKKVAEPKDIEIQADYAIYCAKQGITNA